MTPSSPFPLEGGRAGDGGEQPVRRPSKQIARARRMCKEPTVAERILWSELRKLDANIRRQVPIGPYVADFAHHASKTVIEVDGYYHTTAEGVLRDEARDAWLKNEGFRVLRFEEMQVREDRFVVVEKIAAVVTSPPTLTLPPSRGKGE